MTSGLLSRDFYLSHHWHLKMLLGDFSWYIQLKCNTLSSSQASHTKKKKNKKDALPYLPMKMQEAEGGVCDALRALRTAFVISSDRKNLFTMKSTNHKPYNLHTHFVLLVLQSIYMVLYISMAFSSKQIKHIPFLRQPALYISQDKYCMW